MADNDKYNEEYHFSDPDEINPDVLEVDTSSEEEVVTERQYSVPSNTNVKRNALIAVASLLLLFLLYRLISSYFGADEEISSKPVTPTPQVITPAPRPQPIIQAPVTASPPPAPVTSQIEQRLTGLETSQQNLQANVSSINNQLNTLNTTIADLSAKIADLNQVVENLATKMVEQSSHIERIVARAKPSKPPKMVRRVEIPVIKYYVQAVIPGRAWLIGSNGTTLTVREGTLISGYGTVKLIDSIQGRVLTSSGKTIRFSQQDS